jgi:hypothetical protein
MEREAIINYQLFPGESINEADLKKAGLLSNSEKEMFLNQFARR